MNNHKTDCVVCERAIDPALATLGWQLCGDRGCENTFRSHLIAGRPCCVICGCVSSRLRWQRGNRSVCGLHECQRRMIDLNDVDAYFCGVCGVLLPRHSNDRHHDRHHGRCGSPFCRQWDVRERSLAKERERLLKVQTRRAALVDVVKKRLSCHGSMFDASGPPDVVVLPFLTDKIERPTVQRCQRVEAGLLAMAIEARDTLDDYDPAPPVRDEESDGEDRMSRLSKVACGTCGGRCCRNGGDDGFLNKSKFQERLSSRPGTQPEDIVAEYVNQIPDQTIAGSCIFHAVQGCVLAPVQRSPTCNSYLCTGLKTLRDCVEKDASELALAATNIRDGIDREPIVFRIRIARADTPEVGLDFGVGSHDV